MARNRGLDGLGHFEAWIGALAGGVLSYMGAKEQNKAAGKGGWTDVTTESAPSKESAGYRDAAMRRAYDILNPGAPPPTYLAPGIGPQGTGFRVSDPPASPTPTGNPVAAPQTGGKWRKGGMTVPKPSKPTTGTPAPKASAWNGSSPETQRAVEGALGQAEKGNRLYREAEDFISDTLGGQERNAYRSETADMLRGMDDADLRRFKDMLFEDVESGRPGQGGTPPSFTYSTGGLNSLPGMAPGTGGGSAPAASREGPVGVVDDLKALLEGRGAPQAVKDAIARRNEEEWNKRIAEKQALYIGNNNLGSSNWTSALGDVNTTSARELGDSLSMADYGLWQHGLDVGSQYDTDTLNREAQERMNAADNATSLTGASMSAGASAAAQQADIDARMKLARLDALQGAVGMGQRQNEFRAQGMGSLADLYSQDQRFALGATPDITGLGMRDWTAAGQLSLGSDQGRNQWGIGKMQADAARAGVNATNRRLAFDQERYQHDLPMMDLSRYMDIINAADRGGSTRQFGQTPSNGYTVNPGLAALGGAASGYSLGQSFRDAYGGGGG